MNLQFHPLAVVFSRLNYGMYIFKWDTGTFLSVPLWDTGTFLSVSLWDSKERPSVSLWDSKERPSVSDHEAEDPAGAGVQVCLV